MKKHKERGKALIIINETHHLTRRQVALLKERFIEWKRVPIPETGLSVDGLRTMAVLLRNTARNHAHIVFASPIPYLIKKVSEHRDGYEVYIFVRGTRAKSPIKNVYYPWELIK